MRNLNYLNLKKSKLNITVHDEDEKEKRTIYPNDIAKKDVLENEIKEEISKRFYVMLTKSTLTEEDSREVDAFIRKFIKDNRYFFRDSSDYELFVSTIVNDIFGLGVLEAYIKDETINEIWVLGPKHIWYDKQGKHIDSPIKFKNNTVVTSMINKILAPVNRKADESNPIVDAHLQDGSRVCVTLPPISEAPELVIRKFNKNKRTLDNYVEDGQITSKMANFLSTSIKWGANILVVGGTGSGKTSLLNALTSEIPRTDHVITIEDSRELKVDAPFWQPWETKNANSEGVGAIDSPKLVKNSLRNSPDRIILGEIRDAVAYDVLNAAMTGHKGTMSTIHADNAKEAVERFCTLGGSAGIVDAQECKKLFADTFDLIVVVKKLMHPQTNEKLHLITQICHVVGYGERGAGLLNLKASDDKVYLQNIFALNERTFCIETTGYIPKDMIQKAQFENKPYNLNLFIKDEFKVI